MDGAVGVNTVEKEDKGLVGRNGGMDATVTVRILQEQGFAVQAALVHFAGMADDAVETAQNAAKALDVTLHVIEAADTAADELLKPVGPRARRVRPDRPAGSSATGNSGTADPAAG